MKIIVKFNLEAHFAFEGEELEFLKKDNNLKTKQDILIFFEENLKTKQCIKNLENTLDGDKVILRDIEVSEE